MRRGIGVALMVVGLIGLIWGGVSYVKNRETVDLGVAEISFEEKERIPLPPIASGIALAAGAVLALTGRKD